MYFQKRQWYLKFHNTKGVTVHRYYIENFLRSLAAVCRREMGWSLLITINQNFTYLRLLVSNQNLWLGDLSQLMEIANSPKSSKFVINQNFDYSWLIEISITHDCSRFRFLTLILLRIQIRFIDSIINWNYSIIVSNRGNTIKTH